MDLELTFYWQCLPLLENKLVKIWGMEHSATEKPPTPTKTLQPILLSDSPTQFIPTNSLNQDKRFKTDMATQIQTQQEDKDFSLELFLRKPKKRSIPCLHGRITQLGNGMLNTY